MRNVEKEELKDGKKKRPVEVTIRGRRREKQEGTNQEGQEQEKEEEGSSRTGKETSRSRG